MILFRVQVKNLIRKLVKSPEKRQFMRNPIKKILMIPVRIAYLPFLWFYIFSYIPGNGKT